MKSGISTNKIAVTADNVQLNIIFVLLLFFFLISIIIQSRKFTKKLYCICIINCCENKIGNYCLNNIYI